MSQMDKIVLDAKYCLTQLFSVGSPDAKIKKQKLTPDGPKARRRKKTEENTSTAVKKRKISKESKEPESIPTDTSNAPLYLPNNPLTFVLDSSLTNNGSPLVQPKRIWKRKIKEGVNEAKPSKPAKAELAEGKAEDDDNSSTAGIYILGVEICSF